MRQLIITLSLLLACQASPALEVNQASEADLDGTRGIGPSLSGKILAARQQGPFKDWGDLLRRVKGINRKNAERLSEAGLTVNGERYAAGGK